MLTKPFFATLAVVSFIVSGCSSFSKIKDPERFEQVVGIDKHSSYPAMRREAFEQTNLEELIDPQGQTKERYGVAWAAAASNRDESIAKNPQVQGRRLDLTLSWFRSEHNTMNAEQRRVWRNSVQDRIMSVSTSRCNVFQTYLRREQADNNFWLGTGTTVSGILGAVLPGATASRNLAGMAGIFSGIQAEYNQAYYSNLAAHVITQGIESRRGQMQTRIRKEGQVQNVDSYSLEAAIRDAVYYDGLCSTVVGLEEAMDSIRLATNPGLESAIHTMTAVKAAYEIAQGNFAELQKSGQLDELLKQTKSTITPLAASTAPRTAIELADGDLIGLAAIGQQLEKKKNAVSDSLAKTYEAVYAKLKTDFGKAAGFGKISEAASVKKQIDAELAKLLTPMAFSELPNGKTGSTCIAQITTVSTTLAQARIQQKSTTDIKPVANLGDAKLLADTALRKAELNATTVRNDIQMLFRLMSNDLNALDSTWRRWMNDKQDTDSKSSLSVKLVKNASTGQEELELKNAELADLPKVNAAVVGTSGRSCLSF